MTAHKNASTLVQEVAHTREGRRLLQREGLILSITELMSLVMQERNCSRSSLAKRMKISVGRIDQILDGECGMNLGTVADVFTALGATLRVTASKGLR